MIQDRISQFKRDFSSHTELRAQVNTTRRIGFLGGNLVTNLRSEQGGVSARVYEGGVYGFSSAPIIRKTVFAQSSAASRKTPDF